MVRSKEVPKKPKEPFLTPPSKPRGFRDDDHGGSRPRNRCGAAMSPTPASVPNYMRATSSSDAKAGHHARLPPSSASPPRRRPIRLVTRGKVLFPKVTGLGRATCSWTMKEAKFPDALDLAPGATDAEGPAALRVCPYTYCSLNGHVHAPAVPLRSFLASRRRLIKTQQSMKLKGVSAFRKSTGHQRPEDENGARAKVAPLIDEEALGDFFVEVYAGPRVSSIMSCSDISLDEMDATVRRMEFVIFDRCGADEHNDKGNDPGVCSGGEGLGKLEERLGVCRDSSSECSDAAISGDSVEELSWMRYQGYEYDSLDDDVSEEQGVRDEEIDGPVVSEVQESKDEEGASGRLGNECEEEAAEDQEAKDEENISVLARETEIISEQDGVDCRLVSCEEHDGRDETNNILGTVGRREASTGQETQEGKISVGICKLEIPEQEVAATMENLLDKGRKEETSVDQEAKDDETCMECAGKSEVTEESSAMDEEKTMLDDGSEMEISETVSGVGCSDDLFQEVTSKASSECDISDFSAIGSPDVKETQEGKISVGVCKLEIPEQEVAETMENLLDEGRKEETSVDQEAKDDETCMESAGKSEVTEESSAMDEEKTMLDDGSEMEISETVSGVGCSDDFFQEVTSKAASECEISDFSAIGSPDVKIQKQPIEGHVFEQDNSTVDDACDQDNSTADNTFEQDDNPADSHDDAQKELDIRMNKFEVASEETSTDQGTDREHTLDGTKDVHKELEMLTCNLGDASEDSVIAQECSQDANSGCFNEGAQMVPEIITCKLEDASEESGIAQESSQNCNFAYVENGVEMEPDITTCKFEDASEETDTAQEIIHNDNSAYPIYCAQMGGIGKSELEDTSEEAGIAHGTHQDDNSSYVSVDAHDSGFTTCKLEVASNESVIAQEADQDGNAAGVSDASEEFDVTQEAIQNDNTADPNGGIQKESCESEYAHEESHITQQGDEDDYTACVNSGAKKELKITACESGGASEESVIPQGANGCVNTNLSDSDQKELALSKLVACEELCITEETDLSSNVQIPEHNYDFSTAEEHGKTQNLVAEETDTKESSIDDICNACSGMNLIGDVYIDPTESATCPGNRLIIARRRRTPEEEEYMRGFNPRAPNFLPLELDPEAEKVDLRHQMMDDRKNVEEWMIDYALRRAVNNLGPARKKKVELLVQAFETVLPHDEDDKKSVTSHPQF